MDDSVKGPKVLPFLLWDGEDTTFTARRTDQYTGQPLAYPENTIAKIIFTSGKNIAEFNGTINGDSAVFLIKSDAVANIRNNATWKLQIVIDGRSESPIIGKVSRKNV